MSEPHRLPPEYWDAPFRVEEAARHGFSEKRFRGPAFGAPFVGTRMAADLADVHALCAAYALKMSRGEFFSHTTAARLHGMWLPGWIEEERIVHVAVHKPDRAPRDRRVIGHHLAPRAGLVVVRKGFRVASPVETWCQLATRLDREDLVVAGDSLLAKDRPPEVEGPLRRGMFLSAAESTGRPRHAALRAAAPLLRAGLRSGGEARLSLLIITAGLPEPEYNARIVDRNGRFIAEVDGLYAAARVALEYEGDGHRIDRAQWMKDIGRYEQLADLGIRVIRITQRDLRDDADATVLRIERALRRSSA